MASKTEISYDLLKDKSVIVTGGASGLGRATATKFAEHGAIVTIADWNKELGEKVAGELKDRNLKVSFVQCDVTDWQSQVSAFKHAVNASPSKTLDVAALFAGIATADRNLYDVVDDACPQSPLDQDPGQPETKTIDVNLTGEYYSAWLALYYFRCQGVNEHNAHAQSSKSLILVASLAGYIDFNDSSQYAMSKYGVRGLFRGLRKRIKDPSMNVRCNSINPGYTKTEMTKFYGDNDMRWAPVEAVVDIACLCATDENVRGRSFCTLPGGLFDLEEDFEKGYAGARLTELMTSSGYRERDFC